MSCSIELFVFVQTQDLWKLHIYSHSQKKEGHSGGRDRDEWGTERGVNMDVRKKIKKLDNRSQYIQLLVWSQVCCNNNFLPADDSKS